MKAASAEVLRGASRKDVDRALATAQHALNEGRRAGFSRVQLRALERDVDALRNEAHRVLRHLDAAEAHQRHLTHMTYIDRLSPRNLGMPTYRITTASVPTKALPPLPTIDQKTSRARDGTGSTQPDGAVRTNRAGGGNLELANVEKAARDSGSLPLEQIAAAKKAAQREQSALSRLSPPPVRDIQRLKDAIRQLQKAEAQRRSPSGDEPAASQSLPAGKAFADVEAVSGPAAHDSGLKSAADRPRMARETVGTDRAVGAAEHAARESANLSLDGLRESMKGAQRELSFLLQQSPQPERAIASLKESIKTLQRAESQARSGVATASGPQVRLRHELTQLRSPNLDRQASRQQVGDFSEAVAAGFVHVLLDHGLLSQHNAGDKPQGLDVVAVSPEGQVVTFEVKGTARPDAGRAHTSSTKTGRQGGAEWIRSRSQDGPVQVASVSAVGEAADQVASRLIRVDIAAGEIAVLVVDEKGVVSHHAEFSASLDDVVAAIDGS